MSARKAKTSAASVTASQSPVSHDDILLYRIEMALSAGTAAVYGSAPFRLDDCEKWLRDALAEIASRRKAAWVKKDSDAKERG